MKIYTRTGDSGETGLFDGTRVAKSDPRVAAYGDVDELGAYLGAVRAVSPEEDLRAMLEQIQRDLFAIGARLADPAHRIASRVTKAAVGSEDIARLEDWIDSLEADLPPLRRFILAGGSQSGAALHVARAICRRAERAMVGLGVGCLRARAARLRESPVGPAVRDGAFREPPRRRARARVVSGATLDAAYARCQRMAREHYENFPVASVLLPSAMRPHIAAIYAFARTADDFADEPGVADADRLRQLDDWRERLDRATQPGIADAAGRRSGRDFRRTGAHHSRVPPAHVVVSRSAQRLSTGRGAEALLDLE